MKTQDYSSLFSSLDEAIDFLQRHRTPAPGFVAAFDTLKQARALIAGVLQGSGDRQPAEDERAAA